MVSERERDKGERGAGAGRHAWTPVARAPFIDARVPWRAGGEGARNAAARRAMTAPGSLPLREVAAVVLQPLPLPRRTVL